MIGDPSFKASERKLNTEDTVNEWVEKIRHQVSPFLDLIAVKTVLLQPITMIGLVA